MDFAIVIPVRLKSSRYPGKPLIDLAGKSMIRRVWERCADAVDGAKVFVATDEDSIADHCGAFTDNVIMTSADCLTGTDRVAEAAQKLGLDYVINVQGDEPLIDPSDILRVKEKYVSAPGAIINAMCPIGSEEEFTSVTVPKVVATPSGRLLYMSRAAIPANKTGEFLWGYKQVCIYAFPGAALAEFASWGTKTPLEAQEDIEILRFLEMGYVVQMVELEKGPVAVDTPADRERVLKIIYAQNH